MKKNKITISINKPIKEVFEFTINPKNTHLWVSSIKEEIAEEYPPKINTQYKNRGNGYNWDFYKVLELEENKKFTLVDLQENYHVRYTYKIIDGNKTEIEYFEWMNKGELNNPLTRDSLIKLKSAIEN
ncbi:MAG: hypothetical protein V1860_03180 [bacterium]